ncbi:hypothetical protein HY483_01370 [Candidatus Woesearchaeota archaeon]|nr:hypothetical protein [Candidatus Woesearchaeota archaeon]
MRKNITRILTIILLIFLILLTASCGLQTRTTQVEKGTEGLYTKIFAGNNNILYEDTTGTINVDVENRGAGEVNHGILVLNVPEQFIEIPRDQQKELLLAGRSIDQPVGEQITYTFNVKIREITSEKKDIPTIISASTCYQYKTTASPTVCIQMPDDSKPECKERTVLLGGQGGPLAITSVETTTIPSEGDMVMPIITIKIQNKGRGIVLEPSTVLNACLSTSEKAQENKALIEAFIDHKGRMLTCNKEKTQGETSIKIDEGTTTITCKYDQGIPKSEGTHTSQIIINLAYGYYDITTQKIVIKKT